MSLSLVSTVTVGSGGAASIDFTSIPQTGTDLLVVISGRTDEAYFISGIYPKINGTSGYPAGSMKLLYGTGSSAVSQSENFANRSFLNGGNSTANTFGSVSFYFSNYASSLDKSVSADGVTENNATSAYQTITAGKYTTTSPITSLQLAPDGANFVQYSTASLYTITKGSGGATVS